MSFERMPSKSEVSGWNPHQLAEYLKRMSLSGCDKVVLKNSMNGARFVNMTENDLQKFPKLHAPMISKICSEINRKEERRGLFGRKYTAPVHTEQDVAADIRGWDDDEFDEDYDDYESPCSGDEGSVGDYESPNEEPDGANDYEPPPSEPAEDLTHKLCPSLPMADGDYIDNRDNHVSSRGPPPALCPRPPAITVSTTAARLPADSASSRPDHSPQFGGRSSRKFPAEPPQIFRSNKPRSELGSTPSPSRGNHCSPVERAATHPWRPQSDVPDPSSWPKPPTPHPSTAVSRSNSSARPPPRRIDVRQEQTPDEGPKHNTFPLQNKGMPPRPGLPGFPSRHGDSLPHNIPSTVKLPSVAVDKRSSCTGSDRLPSHPQPPTNTTHTQDLDPRWYVGRVTRGQADSCLKRVNKDGAYLVRDSMRQLEGQPFTLMVFYQDKVYNIQIRKQNHSFLLGTGLKVHETFPTVSDIISHYSQSPLLLIDAKNRSSSQQNQCLLTDPVSF